MKPINIAIIGMGRIGKLHAKNIMTRMPYFKLVKITDLLPDNAWLEEFNIPFTSNIAEIFDDKNIQAILICSPSSYHAEQIVSAAKAKKHIFCEKPLGLTEREILHVINIVKEQSVILQVGFNRRFDSHFEDLKNKITQQFVAKPHILRITSRDPTPPPGDYVKHSGGIFLDMSIHDFDMARFLIGEEVVEVQAFGNALINNDCHQYHDYDTALIHLRFENGTLGIIDNARQASYGYDQRIEVFSNKGCLKSLNELESHLQSWTKDGVLAAKPKYFFTERYADSYIKQLESFYHCIHSHLSPKVTAFDGLQATRLAIAATQSAKSNSPIRVSPKLALEEAFF